MLTNFYSTDWGKKSWTFFLSKAVVLKKCSIRKKQTKLYFKYYTILNIHRPKTSVSNGN